MKFFSLFKKKWLATYLLSWLAFMVSIMLPIFKTPSIMIDDVSYYTQRWSDSDVNALSICLFWVAIGWFIVSVGFLIKQRQFFNATALFFSTFLTAACVLALASPLSFRFVSPHNVLPFEQEIYYIGIASIYDNVSATCPGRTAYVVYQCDEMTGSCHMLYCQNTSADRLLFRGYNASFTQEGDQLAVYIDYERVYTVRLQEP
jgi:hypothetical protein